MPARRVGVELEPALLDRLLIDSANEPGSLPLIQEALVHLWGKRERNLLTSAQYAMLGDGIASGLAAALWSRADASFAALDDVGQTIARRVFLRLVSFGEGRADTRRQQPLSALRSSEDRDQLGATLRYLIEARLLTANGDDSSGEVLIDLAHETLIASWPTLQKWIRKYRKIEQLRRHLEADALEWVRRVRKGRRDVGLLDDGQLIEIDGWLKADTKRHIGISYSVAAFVAASRAASSARAAERDARIAADKARHRRWQRWMVFTTIVLVTLVVAVGMLYAIADRRLREAQDPHRYKCP